MRLLLVSLLVVVACMLPPVTGTVATGSPDLPRSGISFGDAFLAPDVFTYHPGIPLLGGPSQGPQPGYLETSEFMVGSCSVGVILVESDGSIDLSTEDWDPAEEQRVHDEVEDALQWWEGRNQDADLSFDVDYHYGVPVGYEPISRPQSSEGLWIRQAMAHLGYGSGMTFQRVRNYLQDLRELKGTDWAFVIFVVDSSNDPDGCFSDGYFAYAYLGGPFSVLTYDNANWGISRMNRVCAHEVGHIFYATDEYDGETEYSGYLNLPDIDDSGCLMDNCVLSLSTGTWGQIGWRDLDGDGIPDVVDTPPETSLTVHYSEPTEDGTLYYTGSTSELPRPNENTFGSGRDITINHITAVEFRVDSGPWLPASPSDGAFDELGEEFHFTTPDLPPGVHTVSVRSRDSAGSVDPTPALDEVYIASYGYEIGVSPSSITVGQGGNASFEVMVSPTELSGQLVELHLSGLPGDSGSYAFTPRTGNCPFSSSLQIILEPNSPTGSLGLVVEGKGSSQDSYSNAFTLEVVDDRPPTSTVNPLPVSMLNSSFDVTWGGYDNPGGSGIDHFDVQYREDDGPWTDWLVGTDLGSSIFAGEMGKTYGFRCRSVDVAGNVEDYPEDGDAFTTLGIPVKIETPYPGSRARIGEEWHPANQSGCIEVAILPGVHELVIESPTFPRDGAIAYFQEWGDGNTSNPRTIMVQEVTVLKVKFTEEYELEVVSPVGSPLGSGWYPCGTNVTFSVLPIADHGNGTRDRFTGWAGGVSSNSPESWVVMTCECQVVAGWTREYRLEATSPYGNPRGSGWYGGGTDVHFIVDEMADHGNGTRRCFRYWSGDTYTEFRVGSITVDGPTMVVAVWGTQHRLAVGDGLGTTECSWHEEWSGAAISVQPSRVFGNGTRLTFDSWAGDLISDRRDDVVLMNSPKEIEATWRRQHLVIVNSPWGDPPEGGWIDSGTLYTASVNSTWNQGNWTRRRFAGWVGDLESSSPEIMISVDRPLNLSATWNKEYLLVIDSPYSSPVGGGWYPEGGVATVGIEGIHDCKNGTRRVFLGWKGGEPDEEGRVEINGPLLLESTWLDEHYLDVVSERGSPYGKGWYPEGGMASFGVTVPNVTRGDTLYIFEGWTGGEDPGAPETEIALDCPRVVEAGWETWYLLELDSTFSTPAGGGWYPVGSVARVGIETPLDLGNQTRIVCDGWIGNPIGVEPIGTLEMSCPRHLKAEWHREYYLNVSTTRGTIEGGGWITGPSNTTVMVEQVVDYRNGSRYVFAGWEGDALGEEPLLVLLLDSPKEVRASWERECLVSMVFTDAEGRELSPDSGWVISPGGDDIPVDSAGTWLPSGTLYMGGVICFGCDVSPRGLELDVEMPGNRVIECRVRDLRLRLVDILGLPIKGAKLSIELPEGRTVSGTTDRYGGCTLTMVPEGEFGVGVELMGMVSRREIPVTGTIQIITPLTAATAGFLILSIIAVSLHSLRKRLR